MKKFAVLMFALVVATVGMSAQASTILMDPSTQNGSFENPAIVYGSEGVGGTETYFYQFTTPTGWQFTPNFVGDIAVISSSTVAPYGVQFANICASGWLYQSGTCGTFQPNTVYTLTGYGSRNGASTPELGLASGSNSFISVLPATDNYVFTAFPTITVDTSVETGVVGLPIEIVCRSVIWPDPQNFDSFIGTDAMFDNIVLTATSVPEPVTMILLALGGLFLRRK